MRSKKFGNRPAKPRAARKRKQNEITSFSHLRDIRENSPDVQVYLSMSELGCQPQGDELFFVCIYKLCHKTGKYSFNIYNGQGLLVHRESDFFSYTACKESGELQRSSYAAGLGALPEVNRISDTKH